MIDTLILQKNELTKKEIQYYSDLFTKISFKQSKKQTQKKHYILASETERYTKTEVANRNFKFYLGQSETTVFISFTQNFIRLQTNLNKCISSHNYYNYVEYSGSAPFFSLYGEYVKFLDFFYQETNLDLSLWQIYRCDIGLNYYLSVNEYYNVLEDVKSRGLGARKNVVDYGNTGMQRRFSGGSLVFYSKVFESPKSRPLDIVTPQVLRVELQVLKSFFIRKENQTFLKRFEKKRYKNYSKYTYAMQNGDLKTAKLTRNDYDFCKKIIRKDHKTDFNNKAKIFFQFVENQFFEKLGSYNSSSKSYNISNKDFDIYKNKLSRNKRLKYNTLKKYVKIARHLKNVQALQTFISKSEYYLYKPAIEHFIRPQRKNFNFFEIQKKKSFVL